MTRGKPTPGPWLYKHRSGGKAFNIYAEQPKRGCVASINCSLSQPLDEKEANAALIEAAGTAATELEALGYDGMEAVKALPELLDAISLLMAYCSFRLPLEDLKGPEMEFVKLAIKRARGEKEPAQ